MEMSLGEKLAVQDVINSAELELAVKRMLGRHSEREKISVTIEPLWMASTNSVHSRQRWRQV